MFKTKEPREISSLFGVLRWWLVTAAFFIHYGNRRCRHTVAYINPETAPDWHSRGVSSNPKSGWPPVLNVCCFFVWLSVNYRRCWKWRRGRLRTKKKAKRITPSCSVSRPESPWMSCRGQPGCREELVSAAPVFSCRDVFQLSRLKLSRATLPDLLVVRWGSSSSNTCWTSV